MRMIQKISLIAIAFLMVISMVACNSGDTAPTNEVTVTVNAYDINGEPVILGEVTFESEMPTVFAALEAMCIEREFTLDADANGIVSKINGVGGATFVDKETGLNMANGWSWTLNGAEPTGFAMEVVVKTGDVIEYREYSYENAPEDINDGVDDETTEG